MNSLLDFAKEHCTNEVLEELKPVLNMYEKYESLMNTTSIQPQKTTKKNYKELMNFMEEINKETQAMLKQISIRKAEKTANATKRIAELKRFIKFWEQDL